jgi:hypothetical protein
MVFGGIISILIAVWIYRTAIQLKISNIWYWVAGSAVIFLAVQMGMIFVNAAIIEIFAVDTTSTYDEAGGLNARDNSDAAGLQTGTLGTIVGIIFELLPFVVPFFVIAFLRLKFMTKESLSAANLFSGIKEMFISIGQSFKSPQQ